MSIGAKTTTGGTSTAERNPWAPSQPMLNQTLGGLQGYLASPLAHQTYSGPTLAPQSAYSQTGIDAMGNPRGAVQSAGYLSQVLNGDYLRAGNPYLEQVQRSVESSVMPGINATFARAGMTGSTTHQGSLSRGLADAMAPHLFGSYEAERGRQGQAAAMLPQIEAARAAQLLGAGQLQEGYQQRAYDDARARWEGLRTAPLRPYSEIFPFLGPIAGLGGTQTGTTAQTQQQNPGLAQTLLGAGMMGAGLFSGSGLFGPLFGPNKPLQANSYLG